jgi:hypothetical protein
MKKTQNMLVWLSKIVWPSIFAHGAAAAGKKVQQSRTPAAADWLDGLIGQGGLLLHSSLSAFCSFMGGVGKKEKTNLGCEQYCCRATC